MLPSAWIIAAVEVVLLVGLWVVDIIILPPTSSPQHMLWQHWLISPILPVGLVLALLPLGPLLARERTRLIEEWVP